MAIGARVAARLREHRLAVGRPGTASGCSPSTRGRPGVCEGRRGPLPLPTIHSLRHSAATWWLGSGLTVHAVAELLGHADRRP